MDMPSNRPSLPIHARADEADSVGLRLRLAARRGELLGPTAGLAPGRVQANLVVLPQSMAEDFLEYCHRNPQACPLLAVSKPGATDLPALGADIDLRSDLPRYRVWRHGRLLQETKDVTPWWRDELVAFALGCSFGFEPALAAAGLPLRHVELGRNVPMYRTTLRTQTVGSFGGPLVVSMRPMRADEAVRAARITAALPQCHGAPVHVGDPALIGIADLDTPDEGDAPLLRPGELPVFWACGVTPQAAVAAAGLPFCITHAPGHMLITDLRLPLSIPEDLIRS